MSIDPAPLVRYRCAGCGYGASRRQAPERCPMCGGSGWEVEGWTPFADATARRAGGDAEAPIGRESIWLRRRGVRR